jgi:hypothetical protein
MEAHNDVRMRKQQYNKRCIPTDGREPIHPSATNLTIELQIPRKYKECTAYKEAETRLAKAKDNFKTKGTASYEMVAKLNIDCACGAHNELLAEKIFNITSMIVYSICASNTQMHVDTWQQPVEKRTLVCLIQYTRELKQTNISYFNDYLETSSESLCDTIIEKYYKQRIMDGVAGGRNITLA